MDDTYNFGLQQSNLPMLSTGLNREFEHAPSPIAASPTVAIVQNQQQSFRQPVSSPWMTVPTQEPPRPLPFDSDRPTASNTFVPTLSTLPQNSVWNRPLADVQNHSAPTAWSPAEEQLNANARDGSLAENKTALVNINRQNIEPLASTVEPSIQQAAEPSISDEKPSAKGPTITLKPSTTNKPTTTREPTSEKKKKEILVASSVPPKKASGSSSAGSNVSAASVQNPKIAWGTSDESKAKQQLPSLREIQDNERKKQEVRKQAEIERERAARAAAPASGEEKQFTASWGLPTSQASIRTNGIVPPKESPVASPSQPSAPVWTTAKPAAKTMKEIQEEEERQKLRAVKDSVATAAKRAAVVAPAKPQAQQQSGGAWTTVGSSGKSSAPASVTTPTRPPVTSQMSSPVAIAAASRPSASAATRASSSPQVAKAASSAAPKAEEGPVPPSLEFMKWMRDSLQRGLNSSVSCASFCPNFMHILFNLLIL